MSASTPEHINQSQTPFFARGWGERATVKATASMWEKERNVLLSFLKACEHWLPRLLLCNCSTGIQELSLSWAASANTQADMSVQGWCHIDLLPGLLSSDEWIKEFIFYSPCWELPRPIKCLHLTLSSVTSSCNSCPVSLHVHRHLCLYHLTRAVPLTNSLLILTIHIHSKENLKILIWATSSSVFLSACVSKDHWAHFLSSLQILLSHITSDSFLHPFLPACTRMRLLHNCHPPPSLSPSSFSNLPAQVGSHSFTRIFWLPLTDFHPSGANKWNAQNTTKTSLVNSLKI